MEAREVVNALMEIDRSIAIEEGRVRNNPLVKTQARVWSPRLSDLREKRTALRAELRKEKVR